MKFFRNEDGSAIIEVAIMLPVVLMLVFGFMMFTQAIRVNIVAQVAAREGARDYAKTHNVSRAVAKAREELEIGRVSAGNANISAHTNGSERKVIVSIPYPIYVPFAGAYDFNLTGEASFHVEAETKWE